VNSCSESPFRAFYLCYPFPTLKEVLTCVRPCVWAVSQELENKNGTRLEWIVIWLIAVEVALGLVEIAALRDH